MITNANIIEWLRQLAEVYTENKTYLTELDSAIGDADHGANMARGFNNVLEKLPDLEDKDIGTILKNTGMTLIAKVGGASGPLYGTFFMRAADAAGGVDEMDGEALLATLKAGMEGIVQRGRPSLEDKTMYDVWSPALETLKQALNEGQSTGEALKTTVTRAKEAMEATTPMQARKGRASYLGERSIGHQDPGATSTYMMLKALSDAVGDGA
jgi:phosphoenolpyruvate---glycerone phosphotransferase subunit DhaL